MKRTSCIAAAAGLALAASSLAACGGSGGGDAGGQVTIMVGGIDKVIYLPAMLTQQLGYFKDAGVNVKLLTEPSGASAETELVAHKVSGVVGFYDHTVTLQAQGQCIESVVQLAKVPGEVEMVSTKASGVSGPADFKGKKLGVTSPGSSTCTTSSPGRTSACTWNPARPRVRSKASSATERSRQGPGNAPRPALPNHARTLRDGRPRGERPSRGPSFGFICARRQSDRSGP